MIERVNGPEETATGRRRRPTDRPARRC